MRPTQEYEKRLLILFSIYQNGGSAKKRKVLNYLQENNLINLREDDLEFRDTRAEETWRNSFAYIRHHLVEEDYLNANGYDKWELNSSGKKYLRSLINELERKKYDKFRYITQSALNLIEQTKPKIFDEVEYNTLEENVTKDLSVFEEEETYSEGKKHLRFVNHFERKPKLRALAIKYHGLNCMGCNFNFEKRYGKRGKDFIEVHHTKPVSEFLEETQVNPKTDMIVLCSNCHRIVHRERNNVLSLDELKNIINAL